MSERSRRRWYKWLGYVVAAVAIYYVSRRAGMNMHNFTGRVAALRAWQQIACALLFVTHIALNARAYALLLKGMVPGGLGRIPIYQNAWLGSLLAKYIPGGVWQVAGRGLLLSGRDVPPRMIVISGMVEQIVSLYWCVIIVATAAIYMEMGEFLALVFAFSSLSVALLVARAFDKRNRVVGRRYYGTYAVALYGMAMVPYAVGYLVLLLPVDVSRAILALFSGTIAGVAAVFSPGGLGIRESVAVLLVNDAVGPATLAGMAVARMLMLVVEVGFSMFGLSRLRRWSR